MEIRRRTSQCRRVHHKRRIGMWRGAADNSTKIDLTGGGARYVRIIHCQGWAATVVSNPS